MRRENARRVSIDRVVLHGGSIDHGDLAALPAAIASALADRDQPNSPGGIDAIARAVAHRVQSEGGAS